MRILVCAKLVSEPLYTDSLQEQSTSRLSTGKLIMNPADAYGLELALRLRDTRPGSKLTILTLAPRSAENMLHTALAMGADEAVHVCDSCFAGSDTLATAVVLAAAVRAIDFQGLIVCGQKSIDSETGHIGPQLAMLLGLQSITNVLDFQADAEGIHVQQLRDSGTALLRGPDTAVLSVCRGTKMVRRPTIFGLQTVEKKPYRVLQCTDLRLPLGQTGAAGSPTRVVETHQISHRKYGHPDFHDAVSGTEFLIRLIRKTEGV